MSVMLRRFVIFQWISTHIQYSNLQMFSRNQKTIFTLFSFYSLMHSAKSPNMLNEYNPSSTSANFELKNSQYLVLLSDILYSRMND